jgi:hypothetical protein
MSRYASEDPMTGLDAQMDLIGCCLDTTDLAIVVGRAGNLLRRDLGILIDMNTITVHQRLKAIEERYRERTR